MTILSPLADPVYRRLFLAQLLSLLGTGLSTVALGLVEFELAGPRAGQVLGTALALKMVAYVGIAPVVGAFAHRLKRRAFLVALDLIRAAIALALPFVTEIWQVYVLIFALQAGSAAFTPTFQATIPEVLPDEAEYTKALSLSRLAYDLEALASPAIAAALLGMVGFHVLFAANASGFVASALLVASVALPIAIAPASAETPWRRITRGGRIYLATPRLRALLALNLTVAAAGAMVIVNTVVLVRGSLGLGDGAVGWTLAAYGAGSMVAALLLPRLLDGLVTDRFAMLAGAALLAAGLFAGAGVAQWPELVALWALLGFGNGLVLTPSGRLLRRSAEAPDRLALFAAQFALSHACWLLTYPLAGWLGAAIGTPTLFPVLGVVAAIGGVLAWRLWPATEAPEHPHAHDNLPPGHPHLKGAEPLPHGGWRHAHLPLADGLHVGARPG